MDRHYISLIINIFFFSYISIDKVFSSVIILTIYENGNQAILNENFEFEPNGVVVDNKDKNDCKKLCYLESFNSKIYLKFNDDINSCENMFKGLSNIIEIDLSKFDFSHVTSMKSMFQNCTGLKVIEFGNINTSKVENMKMVFEGCKELASIDLSKFDTNLVTTFEKMFSHCEKIKSIDASNFKATEALNIEDMFSYDYELISIDLSNFDTSKVDNMQGLFFKCQNIK